MKVWFFHDDWLDHKGHGHPVYYAVLENNGHVTDGNMLSQTLYMAHDLVACLLMPPAIKEDVRLCSLGDAAKEIELPEEKCVGSLEIGIDILPNGFWVRKGDPHPSKKMPARIRMTERAFKLAYRKFALPPVVGDADDKQK